MADYFISKESIIIDNIPLQGERVTSFCKSEQVNSPEELLRLQLKSFGGDTDAETLLIRVSNNNPKEQRRIEGYWWSEDHQPFLPIPAPNILSQDEANQIYDLILLKQEEAREVLYRGLSHSRIEETMLGCAEYIHDRWVWPEDFAPHYVKKHRVKPSDGFLRFIGFIN